MHRRNGSGWGGIFSKADLDGAEATDPEEHEKTIVDHAPVFPDEPPKKLHLPIPDTDPSAPAVGRTAVPGDTLLPDETQPSPIDGDQLVKQLDKPIREEEQTFFTRQMAFTLIGGLALVVLAILYNTRSSEPEPLPVKTPAEPTVVAPPPPPPVKAAKAPEPESKKPVAPTKAAVPMLSILSVPSGASVEIDGKIYGKTPLITQLPGGPPSLSVRLIKDNFRNFETVLMRNEVGHYSLKATLKPSSPR